MTELFLVRVSDTGMATFGVLVRSGSVPFALTLERPWKMNRRGESCIPLGGYICRRVNSPKFGNTFEVLGVPGRFAILLHKGNIEDDTHGCICVGEQFEPVKGKVGIVSSTQGFAEFLDVTKNVDEFTLHVVQRLPDDAFFALGSTS